MSPAALLVAAAPLAAALAALVAASLTGFDQAAELPVELESRFYGFFLDRYPLYAFAIVYGLARVMAAAFAPGPSPAWRRLAGWVVGTVLILGLSLHPTFGGIVLRAAFGTGSMAFLNQTPMAAAYALGAAAAAALFGSAMGAGVVIAGRGWRRHESRWRKLRRALAGLVSRFLLLWYAFAVLGFAKPAGFGPWPHRPLDLGDTLLAGACLTLAFLPHALVTAGRMQSRSED